jgi:anti-sigma factor RsiW
LLRRRRSKQDRSAMDQEQQAVADSIDEELVAYLDGELDPQAAARVERRLADDASYRARLAQLQRAWDMLDTLQRADADDDFVRSTVAMVTVKAEGDAKTGAMRAVRKQSFAWLALVSVALISAAGTYALSYYSLSRDDRQLVQDLPVIERLDEYQAIAPLGVDFLERLNHEGLFGPEMNNDAQQN